MKKIITLYQEGKEANRVINTLKISTNVLLKSLFFTILIDLIIGLPFVLVIVSLLTVFSHIRIMFWITMILIIILFLLLYATSSVINIKLLENYLETDDIKKINKKAVFVRELLNPWMALSVIIIIVIVYKMFI